MSKISNFEAAASLRDTRVSASQLPAETFPSVDGGKVVGEGSGASKGEGWRSRETQCLGSGALAVTIAVLLGGHAKAQQPTPAPQPQPQKPQQQQPSAQLPEVLVTGDDYRSSTLSLQRYPEPLLTTPQSANVITQQLMQDQGVTSLKDSLRNVSGVSIGAGEGSYQGDNFSIRGFAARSDIYLDGMTDYGSYNRDPFNMEQIEVLKGPDSALFGRGSSGGVVNQESKTPQMRFFTEGQLEYGTDNTERGTLDINLPISGIPNAALRLNAMGDHSEVAERDGASFARWGLAPSLAFGINTPTRLTLSYFHQAEDNVPDYGIPWLFDRPAPVDRRNFYGFNSDYLKTDVNIGTIKFEHDFNDDLTLHEQFRLADYRRNFRISQADTGAILPGTPLNEMIVGRDIIDAVSNDRLIDEDINLQSKFDLGPVKNNLVSGFEFVHQSVDPRRIEPTWANVPNTSLLSPAVNQAFPGTGTTGTEVNATVNTGSIYLTDTAKFGPAWTLIGNVRYDHVSTRYYESIAPTAEFNQDDNLFSYRVGLVYQPKPNGSIYVSSGTSVHPNIAQLALSSEPTLPPETKDSGIGRNFEIETGTKWNFFNERFSMTSALFLDEQTNPAPVDLDDPLLEAFRGRERVWGFEFGAVGHITDKWQVLVNYTLQFSKITAASDGTLVGNPVLNAPKHTANLWTTYELPWNFEAGFGANLVSSRTASESPDPQNGLLMEAPGYIIFSAMLKYHVNKNVDIQANVTNLTDKYYYDGVHPGHINPGEGRVVFISTNFRF
ncbi:MAG TPA: TonB-dependent siderophore receptor [Chthoniobacter sp.]